MLKRLQFLTSGESHGKGLLGILDGLPAGFEISEKYIDRQLKRRQMGHGRGGRMKIEKDHAQLWGGVRHGKTLGSPVGILIDNLDWKNWTKKMSVEPVEEKIKSEAYVKNLRKKKYELSKKRSIPADFGMKNVLIRTNEDVVVDLAKDKIAVWTYGRFQPPHIQHDNLVDSVVDIANYLPMKNVDAYVFTSQSSNKYNQDYEGNEMRKYIRTKQYTEMDGTYGSDKAAAQYHSEPGKGDFLKHKSIHLINKN